MQDRHAVAEARKKLACHGGCERDLRHQQQRAALGCQHRVDGAKVHFGFARTSDAVQQEGAEFVGADSCRDLVEGGLLRPVEMMRRANRPPGDDHLLRLQGYGPFPRQGARREAGAADGLLQVLQIVRPWVQFKKRLQLALGLRQLSFRRAGRELDAELFGRRAQRVALGLHLLGEDEAFALERADHLVRQWESLGQP